MGLLLYTSIYKSYRHRWSCQLKVPPDGVQVGHPEVVHEGVGPVPGGQPPHDPHLLPVPHPPHAGRHPPLLRPAGARLRERHPISPLQVPAGHLQLLPVEPLLVLPHDQGRCQVLQEESVESGIE
jgi:hypothetical protein